MRDPDESDTQAIKSCLTMAERPVDYCQDTSMRYFNKDGNKDHLRRRLTTCGTSRKLSVETCMLGRPNFYIDCLREKDCFQHRIVDKACADSNADALRDCCVKKCQASTVKGNCNDYCSLMENLSLDSTLHAQLDQPLFSLPEETFRPKGDHTWIYVLVSVIATAAVLLLVTFNTRR